MKRVISGFDNEAIMGLINYFLSMPGWFVFTVIFSITVFFLGIRIIRPTQRGVKERLGRYNKYCKPGFHWIIPLIDRLIKINIIRCS